MKSSVLQRDVDFAVMVGSKSVYQKVRDDLYKKRYTESRSNAFVVISPTGLQIDLLPFGAIEIDEEVKFEGQGLTSIKVNGFQEVFNMGTENVTLETGHQFKIATLPSIVLLKFFCLFLIGLKSFYFCFYAIFIYL